MKELFFCLFFSLMILSSHSDAAILVMSPDGTYTTKASLALAAIDPDTFGKTVVVTSALSASFSNISSATLHAWPSDRKLIVEKGGSIGNTTKFIINGEFQCGLQQCFTGTGKVFFGSGAVKHVYPEWWGVLPASVNTATRPSTDYSLQFNHAINSGAPVKLSQGVYWVNAVHNNGKPLIITGEGIHSIIRSYSPSGYAFQDETALGNWAIGLTMNDLRLDGDYAGAVVGGRSGFVIGNPSSYSSSIENAGRYVFNRVAFWNCDKGVYKPHGGIGNTFNKCSWAGNNYGYYATEPTGHTQHVGNDTFNEGEFDSNNLAAVYMKCPTYSAGQTTFNQTIFEYNRGFAVFIDGYLLAYTPVQFNQVHFELNGGYYDTASPPVWHDSTVAIAGMSYNAMDIYLKDVPMAIAEGCGVIKKLTLVNSTMIERNCTFDSTLSTESIDSKSVLISEKVNISYQNTTTKRLTESYGNAFGVDSGQADTLRIPPRNNITRGYKKVAGNDYASANTYSFAGNSGTVNTSLVADGILFDSAAELTIPHTYILSDNTSLGVIPYSAGKWYVWTMDVKLMTQTAPTSLSATGIGKYNQFFGNLVGMLENDKWVTLGGITKPTTTGSAHFPTIVNSSGSSVSLRLSAFQVIEFDTKFDAIKYFNSRDYQPSTYLPRTVYTTVVPSSGTWEIGDRAINRSPSVGLPKAWVCTVSGTFGSASKAGFCITGSHTVTGLTDVSDFSVGQYVTLSAKSSSLTGLKITNITSNSITVDRPSIAAGSCTLTTATPIFVSEGNL